jgi:hypothetical protein
LYFHSNLQKVLKVPYSEEQILKANGSLSYFRRYAISPHHERFSFPFFSGSFFVYRKVDVMRVIRIAKTVASNPSFLDVGCGYGEFLTKIKNHLPNALGIELDPKIFYYRGMQVPHYIKIWDPKWGLDRDFDLVFTGWMEPGIDFRDEIANRTRIIVTTLDQGLSLAAEYEGHGFERIAWWRTPSWEDVNIEIMNRYYSTISEETLLRLSELRGAHNLWYVYSRDEDISASVRDTLTQLVREESMGVNETYDFEEVLDQCGFRFLQELSSMNGSSGVKLWEIKFC